MACPMGRWRGINKVRDRNRSSASLDCQLNSWRKQFPVTLNFLMFGALDERCTASNSLVWQVRHPGTSSNSGAEGSWAFGVVYLPVLTADF